MISTGKSLPTPFIFYTPAYMLTLRHCPPQSSHRCSCEPTSIDENFYRLVPLESPQKKPDDTCIRQFLGGSWLDKQKGWSQEGERMFGGDGYHGYEIGGSEETK